MENASTPEFVQRIAFDALLKLSDEQTQAQLRSEKISQLPSDLHSLAQNGSSTDFANALRTYLNSENPGHFAVLDTIYKINNEQVRPAVIDILRTAPFSFNSFKQIRHIFKIAEYRRDGEVFGLLGYRFEKEPTQCRVDRWGNIYLPTGGYVSKYNYSYDYATYKYERLENPEYKQALQGLAYTRVTREYLIRRVWRTLKQLGEDSDPNYVNMAVGVLLQYSDTDAVRAKHSRFGSYNWDTRQYHYREVDWDAYANYIPFNHILFSNSPRYVLMPNSKAWRCREGYKPGEPEPEVREEAFPELWEQRPDALLQLLLESNCKPVHQFAVKVLRVCQQFCSEIDIDTVIQLINKLYEATAALGFELARERYNSNHPHLDLVLALANCVYQPGRTQSHQWIEQKREFFLTDNNFIVALITSPYSDTRAFARRLLSSSILSDATARVIIGRIIAELLNLSSLRGLEGEIAQEIAETLLISFTPQLRTLGMGVVLDLLRHPMPEIQELGARILLNHETPAIDLPPELIESLLASPDESIRGIGVRIFGQLPDERLLQRHELLLAMATHELPDMRHAIRPVIRRLATEHPEFVTQLATQLIGVLLRKEQYEGVHSDVLQVLREDLPVWMTGIARETALQLLKAKSSPAQELGGLVLSENCDRWTHEFETADIVKLASHEILSVREAARAMFLQILDRIRSNDREMRSAVRLLEAKWDDSREFARQVFNTRFTLEDWTPDVMVSICDSIRDDVRQFGRDLVTRTFQQSYGQDYLLKFSEHPSADMQLFATNYLENYAVDNCDRLRELTPYFITVLCQVNRGRVAKQRVFAFLEKEAQKSESAARVVAEILTRQSLTMAIGDKAVALHTMLKIHQSYPQIPLPIQVKPISEVRT